MSTETIDLLVGRELTTVNNLVLKGVKESLNYIGLNGKDYQENLLRHIVDGMELSPAFTQAATRIVVNKISQASKPSLEHLIEQCNEDKSMLEAMARWNYQVELNKQKSFANMVKDLKTELDATGVGGK